MIEPSIPFRIAAPPTSCALLALFALFAAIAGCDAAGRASSDATVRDSAGVEFVENPSVGVGGGSPAAVEEVVRIGVVEGDDRLQFFRILSLDVAPDGTIAVGNDQTGSVRVFTADGEFLREFGSRGEGPGEYIMINAVRAVGDRVVVTDWQGGGRTGVYDDRGELVEFWPHPLTGGRSISPRALTPHGWIAVESSGALPQRLAPGEAWEYQAAFVRFEEDSGTVTDTVFRPPPRVLYGGRAGSLELPLFDAPVAIDFDAGGNLYLSRGEPYRIEVYEFATDGGGQGSSGAYRLARVITREIEPVPFTGADIEQLKALVEDRFDTLTSLPLERRMAYRDRLLDRIENQRRHGLHSPFLPPLRRLFVSPDGSFWVERADMVSPAELHYAEMFGGIENEQRRPTRWDLFDRDGRFITTVDLVEPRFSPHAVHGLEMTGVLKGEMDVEYVVTYRVVRSG